jgi:hypothetical protein
LTAQFGNFQYVRFKELCFVLSFFLWSPFFFIGSQNIHPRSLDLFPALES